MSHGTIYTPAVAGRCPASMAESQDTGLPKSGSITSRLLARGHFLPQSSCSPPWQAQDLSPGMSGSPCKRPSAYWSLSCSGQNRSHNTFGFIKLKSYKTKDLLIMLLEDKQKHKYSDFARQVTL